MSGLARWLLISTAGAAAACEEQPSPALATAVAASDRSVEQAQCEALTKMRNLTIMSARLATATASTPSYCYVKGAIPPGITYHVQLPLPSAWNGRFLKWGDGTKDGDLDFADHRLAQGYAVANSNMGHDAGAEPGAWFALRQPPGGDRFRVSRRASDGERREERDRRLLRSPARPFVFRRLLDRRARRPHGSAALPGRFRRDRGGGPRDVLPGAQRGSHMVAATRISRRLRRQPCIRRGRRRQAGEPAQARDPQRGGACAVRRERRNQRRRGRLAASLWVRSGSRSRRQDVRERRRRGRLLHACATANDQGLL